MYRNEDIDKININIDKIKNKAEEIYKENNEPTLNENNAVYNAIKKYIITNKKIVYGGLAQHLLIINKNKNDSFYKVINNVCYNWPDIADIEFYSDKPIEDTMKLTEELFKEGFKHIEGKEGVNPDTYKIFINFINYCDISYMPSNIYNNLPTEIVDGIICASPYFMAVDAYRVLNDPLTSYWRLDKTISRFQKILTYYPFDKSLLNENILFFNKINIDIKKYIRKKIIHNSKLIIVGYYAFNYYIKKINKKHIINNYSYYEAISDNLINDSIYIYKSLVKKYKNKINIKQYHPFLSLLDNKISFYYDNIIIFVLYGNNNRCTVYNYSSKKKTYFGTFNLVIMYLLYNYYYYLFNKNNLAKNYLILLSKLFYSRIDYLNKYNLTVIDKSPFQDFTFNCHGTPIDPRRAALLTFINKKKMFKFKYTPSGNISKVPNHIFPNISGEKILEEKYFILKKNNI